MSQPATCTPGQEVGSVHTVAPAGSFVLLTPGPGASDDFGSQVGSVHLEDPENAAFPVEMNVPCLHPGDPLQRWCPAWSSDVIAAQLPLSIPDPGDDERVDRLFTVRIETGDSSPVVFEATGVAVVGPPGSGYPTQPPMHHLFAVLSERQLTGLPIA